MKIDRVFVLLLVVMLPMTGCFDDVVGDAEGTDDSVHENSVPSMIIMSSHSAPVNDNDGTWSSDIELEILALDVDGYLSSFGVDLDLDGTVDVDLSSTLGLGTSITNPAHLSVTFSMPHEQSLYMAKDSSFPSFCQLEMLNVYALVLGDDSGGITTELVTENPGFSSGPHTGLPGTYSGKLNGFNSYGIFDTLQISAADRAWLDGSDPSSTCTHLPEFSITDHADPLTSASGDNLVRIEITATNDIASIIALGAYFAPWISEPANCNSIVTFDGADENNLQLGDAWIISEYTGTSSPGCAPSSPSTVVVQFGAMGMGFPTMAYQEVVVS